MVKSDENSIKNGVCIGRDLKGNILQYFIHCLLFLNSWNTRYIKFNAIALRVIKIAFQNTFGIENILKIDWATSIIMGGNGVY